MSALRFEGVTVTRGARTILQRIDTVFAAARLTVVIGPNGAGEHGAGQVAA